MEPKTRIEGNQWNKCQEQISYEDLLDALRLSMRPYKFK
jgi:hypothetical protein